MYNEYFGLKEIPFSIAPDPRYVYMSEQHREALAHLVYGFNSDGGFVLITGEVGTGKTTICRCLLEQIPENSAIAFILNPKLTVEELLEAICDEYSIRYQKDTSSIKIFIDLINMFLLDAHAQGRKTVLIIDEAQNLSTDVLEQLRLLTNLETNQRKLLQIILLGQPELRDKLSKPELSQLSQRIIARYHLGPLSREDVGAYVRHRLSVAGAQKQLFSEKTIHKLYSLSGGIPRLINVLCDRALLGTFAQGKESVNPSTLKQAALEVFGEKTDKVKLKTSLTWLMALFLIVAFVAVIVATYNQDKSQIYSHAVLADIPRMEKLDSLQWPENQDIKMSKSLALQALFHSWGLTYQHQDVKPACRQAEENGLKCLNGLGSLNTLRELNRPAMLRLFDDSEKEYYATLTALGSETATIVVGADERKIAVKDIESHWFGFYSIFWRTPPNYRGVVRVGDRGPYIRWLNAQLSFIRGGTDQVKEKLVFDKELLRQVKRFQISEGLIPDGIVGFKTLIHINSATEQGVPTLSVTEEDL